MLKKVWPIFIIAFLVCLFFSKCIISREMFMIFDADYYYSLRAFYGDALKSHILPFWNPYLNSGFSLIAIPFAGVFDPLNAILFYLLPNVSAYNYLICLYFFTAGLFTFLFCRSLELNRLASLFSAIIVMFGAFSGKLPYLSLIFSASFLPLILFAIRRYFQKEDLRYILLAGLGMGLSFLAGHSQMAVYVIVSAVLYFLFHLFFEHKDARRIKTIFRHLGLLMMALIIGFGISAIQNLPTLELKPLTDRAVPFLYNRANIRFQPRHLLSLVFPYFFGTDTVAGYMPYRGTGSFWELYMYMGILPLCFLFASLGRIIKDKRVLFFSFLGIFSLLAAMGKNSPIYFLLYHCVPGIKYFKDPNRFIVIFSFAAAILSGLGLHFVMNDEQLKKRMFGKIAKFSIVLIAGLVAANIIFYFGKDVILDSIKKAYASFYNLAEHRHSLEWHLRAIEKSHRTITRGINLHDPYKLLALLFFAAGAGILCIRQTKKGRRVIFGSAIIIVTVIDLFIFWSAHNITVKKSLVASCPDIVRFLNKNNKQLYRVFINGPTCVGFNLTDKSFLALIDVWHIASANESGPLFLSKYKRLIAPLGELSNAQDVDERLRILKILNTKYVLSPVPIKTKQWKLVYDDAIKAYESPDVTPRAYIAYRYEVIKDEGETIAKIQQGFDTRNLVLLEKEPPEIIKESQRRYSRSQVKVVKYRPTRVDLDVSTSSDGLLVLSDTYYPGWKAFVDGEERELLRANLVTRAVPIKRGEHKVTFVYLPLSLRIGFTITLSTLLILLIVFLLLQRRQQNRSLE